MFYFCFLSIAFSLEHYIYISNDGSNENDGRYDSPLNASDLSQIGELIKKLSPEGTDHIHLVFKEGIYFSEDWSIRPWEFNHEKINHITIEGEPNKKAIIHGSKRIKNWEKSTKYEKLWRTTYSNSIDQLFVGDHRATLCRLPKSYKRARFYGYETQEDPTNSSYIFRILYVQTDCIEMLKKMTPEELSITEVVVTYWWYTDVMKLIRFDEEKKYIVTRILKSDEHDNEKISETSYFFIQGAFPSITEPGEYYQHPDGTLYYYPFPDEDMKTINVYIPITQHAFNFYAVNNLMIQNLYFNYMNDVITGAEFNNLCVYNCEFKHVKSAVSIYGAHNSQVDHCFIEDTANVALSFSGNNFTVQNCIIRHVGVVPPYRFAIDFWNDVNNTFILNNDISDGRSSLVHFGYGNEYEVQILKNVLIENNHIHHSGYGIFDDIAALFFGKHPRGTVINHNKIHDFFSNNYCGNGIYPDHGSSGTIVTNNIVYNVSHSTFNLHWGKENDVSNNIMAYARTGFSFGYYHSDSYTLNIHHNIVYLDKDESFPAEGPLLNDDVKNIFDHNIYYKTNNRDITIAGLSFDEWKQKGFDQNSFVIDPMFNNPEKGDFTFKSKENINKIGFEEFNMSFGVIGNDWRARAEN